MTNNPKTFRAAVDSCWNRLWSAGLTDPLHCIQVMAFALVCTERELYSDASITNTTDMTFLATKVKSDTGLEFNGAINGLPTEVLRDVLEIFGRTRGLRSRDALGDSLEMVLDYLNSAGRYGQFRTPSHIAHFMVRTIPIPKGTVLLDPAAGTGGFLVAALSERSGQQIEVKGDEIDRTMVNVARANLLLAGKDPGLIRHRDALAHLSEEADAILANPPFAARISNRDSYALTTKSKKSEFLFTELIVRRLRMGGIASFIVPSGVLTNTDGSSVSLRRQLLTEGAVLAIIELPRGVFRPYTDILTAIVYWKKGGSTTRVPMFRPASDGFTLDDRRLPCASNELSEIEPEVKLAVSGQFEGTDLRTVELQSILDNSCILLPTWYSEAAPSHDELPDYDALVTQARRHAEKISSIIKDLGIKL